MYYVLCANWDETASCVASEDSTADGPFWRKGSKLGQDYDLTKLCFVSETEHAHPFPDFSRDGHGCPIVSERLKKLFDSLGIENIDYYPAQIIEHGSTERKDGYYAANIIGLVKSMDRDASEFEEDEDGLIDDIDLLVVDAKTALEYPIFRMAEMPSVILIHGRYKKPIEEAHITGLQLVPTEDWDGYDGFKGP